MTANQDKFIGRATEMAELTDFLQKKTASLIVIKGRRRVGKSRLIEEFAKGSTFYKFTGLAPVDGVTAQSQRNEFARQLSGLTGLPEIQTDDWSKLFALLAREVRSDRVIILLDEISWMAHDDATFLSKLKNFWDDHFKKNPKLLLIVCGSVSTWIEDNIISSKAFFGRISWKMHLDPLPLSDCNKMLNAQGFKYSPYEKFKILCVTNGIPWYIEQIQSQYNADENIKRQCFNRSGTLYEEFDLIFRDMFEKRDYLYKEIILALKDGPTSYDEISSKAGYPKSGRLTQYLKDLIEAGFVKKDFTWSIKTGKAISLNHYRISDNYIRFYLKYITPRVEAIEKQRINAINLTSLAGWETTMGLQFENLVINNRHEFYNKLNIDPADILFDNPFFQNKTTRQKGCQIDFLIQTKFNTLFLFEIKFSKNLIKLAVVESVKEKIRRLNLPRNYSVLPVLVHVNGIADSILEEDYFYSITDFSDFLHN